MVTESAPKEYGLGEKNEREDEEKEKISVCDLLLSG